jgi:PIN domain nuclease of toxin-antitoxin system
MDLLLDTHAFLWAAASPSRLGPRARRAILDPRNRVYLSLASVWEMAIKASLGKLRLSAPLSELVARAQSEQGITLLPLELDPVLRVQDLPWHHRDPFDRLIIAQAVAGSLAIVGRDSTFDAYPVRRIW